MTAATGPRNTKQRSGDRFSGVVKAGVTIYAGTMVARDGGYGHLVPAGTPNAGIVAGVAEETVVGDGVATLTYKRGVFLFAAPTAAGVVGTPLKPVDDQTLEDAGVNDPVSGIVLGRDSDEGRWVLIGFSALKPAPLAG